MFSHRKFSHRKFSHHKAAQPSPFKPNPSFGWAWQRGGLFYLLLAMLTFMPAGRAEEITQASVTQILDSSQVYIQEQQAKLNDIAVSGQRVRTGQARAQLRFNTGAVARLATNSALTVNAKCARLDRGVLLVSGAASGCTRAVVVGVRGTTYTLEVDEQGETIVKVFEGTLNLTPETVARTPNTFQPQKVALKQGTPAKNVTVLQEGQKVRIEPVPGQPSRLTIEPLTYQDFADLFKQQLLDGFKSPLPTRKEFFQAVNQRFPGAVTPEQRKGLGVGAGSLVEQYCSQLIGLYKTNLELLAREGWKPATPPATGFYVTQLEYTISNTGQVGNMKVARSSGYPPLDQSAVQRVYEIESQLRPIPSCLPAPFMYINHRFELTYQQGVLP